MNARELKKLFAGLPLGKIRYFDSVGSTNDEALAWAMDGAPDLSLVIADEQTAGRGRLDRKWITPKGCALAFSVVLRPTDESHLSRTVGLAALSIADSCLRLGLAPRIKWPNDILINDCKAAGILVENIWSGENLDCMVIGMGINVAKDAVPPMEALQFPAISLEDALGYLPKREDVLRNILSAFIEQRETMSTDAFLSRWQNLLAYRDQLVEVRAGSEAGGEKNIAGTLIGLESDGSLRLRDSSGAVKIIRFGDVHLRPAV